MSLKHFSSVKDQPSSVQGLSFVQPEMPVWPTDGKCNPRFLNCRPWMGLILSKSKQTSWNKAWCGPALYLDFLRVHLIGWADLKSCGTSALMVRRRSIGSLGNQFFLCVFTSLCASPESMSWSELQRLLQLFVFESMRLTTVDESGCLKGPDPATPTSWDNPVEYSKHLYWNNRCTPGVTRAPTW